MNMQTEVLLKKFGLSDKEIAVYQALIQSGPSPVRLIAQRSKVNRGTTYDILKSLVELGLVTYYNKQTHQYFSAESPEKLIDALADKQQQLEEVKKEITTALPELKMAFARRGGQPQIKLYEGLKGVKQILEDVLATMAKSPDKTYYVYSSSTVRKNVYQAMPDFSDKRISKKIKVQTIALGPGGELRGLDERRWMKLGDSTLRATYEIIYSGKVAHISLDETDNPVGVIIENQAIYQTQRELFLFSWENCKSR